MAARARGVLVIMLATTPNDPVIHEYPKADAWKFEEFADGVWLHVLGADGQQIATFRPKTYDRPEVGRMRTGG